MRRFSALGAALAPVLCLAFAAHAPAADADAHQAFSSARLGLYVPWGVSSLLGKGDRVMETDKLPVSEYEKLLPRFNPSEFDAETWVKIAKAAGAKYLVVASKPPDGFCMYETRLSPYNVVAATPLGRDPLKALTDACRKHEIACWLSYSLVDWHHPSYAAKKDWENYVKYYQGQIRELCTQYGSLGGLWLEGANDRPDDDWDLPETLRMIRELQPTALVGVSRRGAPWPGLDVRVVGPDVSAAEATSGPLSEIRLTLNQSWGYSATDRDYKSSEQLIHALANAAGRGTNLLIVLGPRPDGTLPTEAVERLLALGKWLDKHGTTIRDSRPGPIPPQPWGVSTVPVKPGSEAIYLHITKPGAPIAVPAAFRSYEARLPGTVDPLKITRGPDGALAITYPETNRSPFDTVIVLTPAKAPHRE